MPAVQDKSSVQVVWNFPRATPPAQNSVPKGNYTSDFPTIVTLLPLAKAADAAGVRVIRGAGGNGHCRSLGDDLVRRGGIARVHGSNGTGDDEGECECADEELHGIDLSGYV